MEKYEWKYPLFGQALSFQPVYPQDAENFEQFSGVFYQNGQMWLQVYAPGACEVGLLIEGKYCRLQEWGKGCWRIKGPEEAGFYYAQIIIDGAEVLLSMLPIGFGNGRPYNYLEIGGRPEFCKAGRGAHGTVSHEYYFSQVTGRMETCIVYTPPEYLRESRAYPVLYLQHGRGENETAWIWQGGVNFIMDHLLAQGRVSPMIIVMSSGMIHNASNTEEMCSNIFLFEELILRDIMPCIESKYRIVRERRSRAVAGLSMGSVQASVVGLEHMDLFGGIGLFSGFLRNPYQSGEQRHIECLKERLVWFKEQGTLLFRAMGNEDRFWDRFAADDELCRELQVPQKRMIYPGGHDWNVWRKCIYDFLPLLFKME